MWTIFRLLVRLKLPADFDDRYADFFPKKDLFPRGSLKNANVSRASSPIFDFSKMVRNSLISFNFFSLYSIFSETTFKSSISSLFIAIKSWKNSFLWALFLLTPSIHKDPDNPNKTAKNSIPPLAKIFSIYCPFFWM